MLRLLILMCLAVAVLGIAIDTTTTSSTQPDPAFNNNNNNEENTSSSYVNVADRKIMNVSPVDEPNTSSSMLISTDDNSLLSKVATALGPVPRYVLSIARNIFDNSYWTIATVALSFIITSGICYLTPLCTLSTPYFNVENLMENQIDRVLQKYLPYNPYAGSEPDNSAKNSDPNNQEQPSPVFNPNTN